MVHLLSRFSSSEAVPDQSNVAPSSADVGIGCKVVLPTDGLKSTNSDLTGVFGSERGKGVFVLNGLGDVLEDDASEATGRDDLGNSVKDLASFKCCSTLGLNCNAFRRSAKIFGSKIGQFNHIKRHPIHHTIHTITLV